MDSLDYLLTSDRIVASAKWNSRKQVLLEMAGLLAAETGLDKDTLFEGVMERERLGSTGVGEGVAIPHVRSAHIEAPMGVFVRLVEPVDFNAIDDRPCDLIFMLLTPEDAGADHLRALSRVARLLRQESVRSAIRKSPSIEAISAILCPGGEASDAA